MSFYEHDSGFWGDLMKASQLFCLGEDCEANLRIHQEIIAVQLAHRKQQESQAMIDYAHFFCVKQ